jgi:hypothetical protein
MQLGCEPKQPKSRVCALLDSSDVSCVYYCQEVNEAWEGPLEHSFSLLLLCGFQCPSTIRVRLVQVKF